MVFSVPVVCTILYCWETTAAVSWSPTPESPFTGFNINLSPSARFMAALQHSAGKQPVQVPYHYQPPMLRNDDTSDSDSEIANPLWKSNCEASTSAIPPPAGLYQLDDEGNCIPFTSRIKDEATQQQDDFLLIESLRLLWRRLQKICSYAIP